MRARPAITLLAVLLTGCAAGATAGGSGGRPRLFRISGAALAGPKTIEVRFEQGYVPCYGKLGHVAVRPGDDRVTVTLHRTYPKPPDPHRMCAQFQVVKTTRVHLHAPLAGRTLIDGSTGKPVPLH